MIAAADARMGEAAAEHRAKSNKWNVSICIDRAPGTSARTRAMRPSLASRKADVVLPCDE